MNVYKSSEISVITTRGAYFDIPEMNSGLDLYSMAVSEDSEDKRVLNNQVRE